MATKDWKKIIDRKTKIEWVRKIDKSNFIMLDYVKENFLGRGNKEGWRFYVRDAPSGINYSRYAKTKSQALKFAKSYMRKN